MSVILRLYQEGDIRSTGFQTTEWIDSNSLYTTPAYRQPFVLHSNGYGIPDSFDRIADPIDFGELLVNPLTAFDIKQPYTVNLSPPNIGDTLRIDVSSLPHWATTTVINGQSYVPTIDGFLEFTITGAPVFRSKQPGDLPPSVNGNNVVVSNYQFKDEDVGRTVSLSGFTNSANNHDARILGTLNGVATTDRTFINESGTSSATWSTFRILVDPVKPFPRIEGAVNFQVKQAVTGTIIVAGTHGGIMRLNPDLTDFRDDRLTLIHATETVAQDHFNLVQSYLRSLQRKLGAVGSAFGSVGPYDFGP